MSTNYYIRRTKPILVFPEFHIGKRSRGWKALFEANDVKYDSFSFETERPVVESVDDIRSHVESGEWEIFDEYEEQVTFDEFMSHMLDDFEDEGERRPHGGMPGIIVKEDGTEFMRGDFR